MIYRTLSIALTALVLLAAPALAQTKGSGSTIDYSAKARMADAPKATPNETAILQQIQADAQAALDDANTNNDVIASTCYAAIVKVTTARLAANTTPGGGLLFAFQKLRDVTKLNSSPLGTALIVGCAPLVQDAKINMIQFFTSIGGIVLLKGVLL